jgi:formylmethanofuran:tetrahydromethanopterin formyltransferase
MYDEAEETLRVLGQCAAQESDEKNAARVAAYGVITHVTGANCAFDRDLSGNLTPRGREGRMIYLLRARKNLREMRRKLECTSLAVA